MRTRSVLAGRGPEATSIRAGIRLLARLARVAEQSCQSTGISLPQYRLLVAISGGKRRAGELAESVGVSRPTLTSLVDGLEQSGLLRRVPVATDRRCIELAPTESGRRALEQAERALAERIVGLVDARRVRPVRDLVTQLGAALDREPHLESF